MQGAKVGWIADEAYGPRSWLIFSARRGLAQRTT